MNTFKDSFIGSILIGIFNIFKNIFDPEFIKLIINNIKLLFSTLKVIINEILIKHFNSQSYLSIFGSLLNISENKKLYKQSKQDYNENMNNSNNDTKISFPLPKLQDEPDSISNPVYITLIIRIVLAIIFILIIVLISSIILNIGYALININTGYNNVKYKNMNMNMNMNMNN